MIPNSFKKYIFYERRAMIEKMARGEIKENNDVYLWFTRALPAIVTNGPAGLNASIKMVGFVLKENYLDDAINKLHEIASEKRNIRDILQFLLNYVYNENKIDFSKLATLDLARKRTWQNLRNGGEAILIFYTPPDTSYMIIADTEVHLEGSKYFEYVNALHDIFHVAPTAGRIVGRHPTYIFKIREIWDKSVTAFGKKIYP